MKRFLFAIAAVIVIAGGVYGYRLYQDHRVLQEQMRQAEEARTGIPAVEKRPLSSSAASEAPVQPVKKPRTGVNWDVPFTPQAPTANWDAMHEEACEEASVLMVLRYFADQPFASPADAEQGITALVKYNEVVLGYPVDQTAAQIVELIHGQDPTLNAVLLKNPTPDALKKVLSAGKLVIVPADGQALGNPYFQRPGPPYHMLVLRGYSGDDKVITNDPGTKRGEGYVYTWDALLAATHDWNGGDVPHGEKVVVVVGK